MIKSADMRDRRERQETTISLDGSKLLAAMNLRGLSAAKLAELSGCAPNTITGAVHGRPITTGSVRKIAKVIDGTPVIAGLAGLLPDREQEQVA